VACHGIIPGSIVAPHIDDSTAQVSRLEDSGPLANERGNDSTLTRLGEGDTHQAVISVRSSPVIPLLLTLARDYVLLVIERVVGRPRHSGVPIFVALTEHTVVEGAGLLLLDVRSLHEGATVLIVGYLDAVSLDSAVRTISVKLFLGSGTSELHLLLLTSTTSQQDYSGSNNQTPQLSLHFLPS
jgi:hypothetical protein